MYLGCRPSEFKFLSVLDYVRLNSVYDLVSCVPSAAATTANRLADILYALRSWIAATAGSAYRTNFDAEARNPALALASAATFRSAAVSFSALFLSAVSPFFIFAFEIFKITAQNSILLFEHNALLHTMKNCFVFVRRKLEL